MIMVIVLLHLIHVVLIPIQEHVLAEILKHVKKIVRVAIVIPVRMDMKDIIGIVMVLIMIPQNQESVLTAEKLQGRAIIVYKNLPKFWTILVSYIIKKAQGNLSFFCVGSFLRGRK